MKYIFIMTFMLCALMMKAQKVEISVSGNWAEIPVQQTQSELKPGWKIVDYQMKSRLTRYLSGGHASQLAEGNRPVFRITPGENEVLASYAIIRLNDELCQLRSRNTGHCWMIWKNYNADPFRIELYHKHHRQDKYYHQQRRQVCSVRNAIRIIKEHDRYVLSCRK